MVEIKLNRSSIYLKLERIVQPAIPMLIFFYQEDHSSKLYEKTDSQCNVTQKILLNEDQSSNFKSWAVLRAAGTPGFTHTDSC